MKHFFTLIFSLLLSASLLAFPYKSVLSISSASRLPVIISVDNIKYTEKGDNSIMVRNINAGFHTIRIFQKNNGWNGGGRHGYNDGYNQQVIYSGNIYVKPGVHTDIIINRFGKAYIDERQINSMYYGDDDQDCYDWNSGNNNGGYNNNYHQAMEANNFRQLKQTINNAAFDNTKMSIAKQAMSNNYFNALQVKELMGLFSFENSKLDIAKSAYRNSVDKNNYFIVSDALTFSSSKEELARFIQSSR